MVVNFSEHLHRPGVICSPWMVVESDLDMYGYMLMVALSVARDDKAWMSGRKPE